MKRKRLFLVILPVLAVIMLTAFKCDQKLGIGIESKELIYQHN